MLVMGLLTQSLAEGGHFSAVRDGASTAALQLCFGPTHGSAQPLRGDWPQRESAPRGRREWQRRHPQGLPHEGAQLSCVAKKFGQHQPRGGSYSAGTSGAAACHARTKLEVA